MPNNLDILLEVEALSQQVLESVQAYAPIQGASGADGREVTLRVLSQILQWKYVDEASYTDLIDFSTLTLAASNIQQSTSYRFVTDTEKTTWNGKQNELTNPVTGTGTNNYLTKWSNGQIVNSSIIDTGPSGSVGVGTSSPIIPFQTKVTTNTNIGFSNRGANISAISSFNDVGSGFQNLHIDGTYISLQSNSNGNVLINTTTNSTYKLDVNGTARASKFYVTALNTAPSSASDTGTAGEIRFTSTAIYICTATNTWRKADISTW